MREGWKSQPGFLLASLGSSVGLGNIWRFSYVAGENGGGAFLLVYVAMLLLIGLPLLLGEFALGRRAHCESSRAMHAVVPAPRWRLAGMLGVVISCVIMSYYPVIAGWVSRYLFLYLAGGPQATGPASHAQSFHLFISHPLQPLAWHLLVVLLTVGIVSRGIRRGIEAATAFLMPILALMVLALAIYGITLPGFREGAEFLFKPDWSVLATPGVYVAALGQAFFSIGVGMGVMVTYGSYLGPGHRLPLAAAVVAGGDTLIAIAAGLVIFPAVFSFGLDPASGPSLAFIVMPQAFEQIEGGRYLAIFFFALLLIAALTSMLSLVEVVVAYLMAQFGWSRRRAVGIAGIVIYLLGMPVALGYGAGSVLGAVDRFAVHVLLPLNGLLLAVFIGWAWPRQAATAAAGLRQGLPGRAWHFALRYIAPLLLASVLLAGIL
ncbi:sodium-dependent transporter [Lacisediminimonas profundi]|uniref:sodium-dependent transporter n=1 Tax=Lacisediminimonas profundi TaxID=2603856 RepID=UPI00124B2224|nr:sodium-dependent transporter [Lacisediminimonas profundi]